MADLKEQRICIKFCFNIEKTSTETHQMLKDAFGDNAMSKNQTFLWYERFKDGRTSVEEDDERSPNVTGGSSKKTQKNTAKVRKTISPDRKKKTQTKKK